MNIEHVAPGVAVTLHTPMKPSTMTRHLMHAVESGEMLPGLEWRSWRGFTHGIILFAEDGGKMLYLLLYDPIHSVFYCDERQSIPVRTLFHYDEVDFLKNPGDFL